METIGDFPDIFERNLCALLKVALSVQASKEQQNNSVKYPEIVSSLCLF